MKKIYADLCPKQEANSQGIEVMWMEVFLKACWPQTEIAHPVFTFKRSAEDQDGPNSHIYGSGDV